MSAVGIIDAGTRVAEMVLGGLKVGVNRLWQYQPIPANRGNLFEPRGDAQLDGARIAASMLHTARVSPAIPGNLRDIQRVFEAGRDRETLLASTNLQVPDGGGVGRLHLDAQVEGVDWGERGRESIIARAYVDGQYTGDVVLLRERNGAPYALNLGTLEPGAHAVELRAADGGVPAGASVAVRRLETTLLTGDLALADRFAPVIQQRDLPYGGRVDSTYSDTPLVLAARVSPQPDGARRITYFAMFSSEDGGTVPHKLLHTSGRITDYEPVVELVVDARGALVGAPRFQGPLHRTYEFRGAWDGTRPVLRVATANNNFSAELRGRAPVWAGATTMLLPTFDKAVEDKSDLSRGATGRTDLALMLAHPWTFAVMGKEALREHRVLFGPVGIAKAAARIVSGKRLPAQFSDLRRVLVLRAEPDPLRTALAKGGTVQLLLRDGRRVPFTLTEPLGPASRSAGVLLPGNVTGTDITGIEGVDGGRAVLLDAEFRPHQMTARKPVRHA